MKTKNTQRDAPKARLHAARRWMLLGLGGMSFGAFAAVTDIANSPLDTSSVTEVKPNIMFILDDSGSMAWDYMPDSASSYRNRIGHYSHLCNEIYYNPAITYTPPPKADDSSYANASFTNAPDDGFKPTGSKSDLSKYRSYGSGRNTKYDSAFYYKWIGNGSPSDTRCKDSLSSSAGAHKTSYWEKVILSTNAEKQNFANWYSYYRTRILAMKSAAGKAFSSINDEFRVGYITINPGSTVSSSKYLPIADFKKGTDQQKEKWFDKLYGASVTGGTPLREALSRVGRHYAGKTSGINKGMNEDPVQYSCQQNYAILTTDGFWNGNAGRDLDGNTLTASYDSDESTSPRPLYDGGAGKTGYGGSLADVAKYYYDTDLRDGMDDDVQGPSGDDIENNTAKHQHMVTYTMGLGVDGELSYRTDYKEAATGDYADIKAGNKNWPKPEADKPSAIDDMWHAAVNGRGRYFSAKDPDAAAQGLQDALNAIAAEEGQGAAVSASNPVLTPDGVNRAFESGYRTQEWSGDLVARSINSETAELSAPLWSAKAKVDATVGPACDNRTIKLFRAGATNNLVDFTWDTKACDAARAPTGTASTGLNDTEKALFDASTVALLNQHTLMTATQRTNAAGKNLVNFLRGQRQHENFAAGVADKLYRTRTSVLGDIVHSQSAFVGKPRYEYADAGYSAYRTAQANRQGMVYVAGNDGMLHAFNADNGTESWAFIPSFIAPTLYELANTGYGKNHRFLLDGSPIVGDVYFDNAWKTLLVGGAGRGGVGYYALDVTSPATPKALWEFKYSATCYAEEDPTTHSSDCHLGRSIAEPRIAKLSDGTWVVLVTSGYNNNTSGKNGDGIGYLYVLNAKTGKILKKIATTAGNSTTPSGLGKMTVYGPALRINNTALYVYAGDLLGNVWRFDPNNGTVFHVAQVKDEDDNPQPITTRIVLGETGIPATLTLFFGTGRYLGLSDIQDTSVQTVYAIKDNGATTLTDRTVLDERTFTDTSDTTREIATSCARPVRGWYLDLPDEGERLSIDPQFLGNVFVFGTSVPSDEVCVVGGGYSWLNFLDAETGCAVPTSNGIASKFLEQQLPGLAVVIAEDGKTYAYKRDRSKEEIPGNTDRPSGRVISKRELVR